MGASGYIYAVLGTAHHTTNASPECDCNRGAALMPQSHVTRYFCKAKESGVQWQLNRSYSLTCTPGHVAAQFSRHGNCTTATVDTVALGMLQAACVSKITVELTTFLP